MQASFLSTSTALESSAAAAEVKIQTAKKVTRVLPVGIVARGIGVLLDSLCSFLFSFFLSFGISVRIQFSFKNLLLSSNVGR